MDTAPEAKKITLQSGLELTLRELTFRDMVEFEDQGHTLGKLSEGAMTPMAYLMWMMCRGDHKSPSISWEDFKDKMTLVDFMRHRDTVRGYLRDPLEQSKGEDDKATD